MISRFFYLLLPLLLFACTEHQHSNHGSLTAAELMAQEKQVNTKKPGTSFTDTLIIKEPVVLLYQPDSLQMIAIKNVNTPMVFESMTHEYVYQIKNAKNVLSRFWPTMKFLETNHARYVQFIKKDNSSTIVDLNALNDITGILLFNAVKEPLSIDMMNIDTELNFYFKQD